MGKMTSLYIIGHQEGEILLTHWGQYMLQWIRPSFVQIITCWLFMSLHEPLLTIATHTLQNQLWWNLNQNSIILIHENAFENAIC